MKKLKFSVKFRPNGVKNTEGGQILTTTRLFDDKNLSEGDRICLLVAETDARLGIGTVVMLEHSTYSKAFGAVDHSVDNLKMYQSYYPNRAITNDTEVLDLRILVE